MPRYALGLFALALSCLATAGGCNRAVGQAAADRDAARDAARQPIVPGRAGGAAARDAEQNDDREAKTPLIQALLDKLDELDVPQEFADDGVEKQDLRDMLLAADEELAASTGPKLREKILQANRRRPAFVVRPQRFLEPEPAVVVEPTPAESNAEELPAPQTGGNE